MKFAKKIALAMLLGLLTLAGGFSVLAADSHVTYSGNAGSFIFSPGGEYSPTDLFPNFKDVMPGDSIRQLITLRNDAHRNVKVKIYLRALGAHPDSKEFLSQLTLRVVKETDTVMFDASADETAQLTDWVLLGTLYSGGETQLAVVLDVPVTLDNAFADQVAFLDWEFMVQELPVEPDDPQPPTGDSADPALAAQIMLISGLLALALILMRRFCAKTEE